MPDSAINVFRVDNRAVVKACEPNRPAETEILICGSETSLPVPKVCGRIQRLYR